MTANLMGGDGLIVLVIAIVVLLGGSQLPKIARNVGIAGKEFRKAQEEAEEDASRQKQAKAAGVCLVAIGFGDERGSEIVLTDPATGARSFLTDRDGQLVRTRLDGKTLREMALITDGAYVPAGIAAPTPGGYVSVTFWLCAPKVNGPVCRPEQSMTGPSVAPCL